MGKRRALIVAGESSGDLHGGNLLKAASRIDPDLEFFGVGGARMKQAGCRLLFSSAELSVMGLVEVVAHLPRIVTRYRQLKTILRSDQRPDLLVLIDFPDFNLRLAKVAKKSGVPVLYYISPKVWAWRRGRIKTIGARVDRLALIFPFEPELFKKQPVEAVYVGNPLLDEFAERPKERSLRDTLEIDHASQIVGLFPGSRSSEVKYIFETLLESAMKIQQSKPDVVFLLPVAPSLHEGDFEKALKGSKLNIVLVKENIYDVASACDAVLTVSGTVTLQVALSGTPMTVLYKASPLTYAVGSRLVQIPYFSLVNIVAGKQVVREFLQDAADADALSGEILNLLDDQAYAAKIRSALKDVQELMGSAGCSKRVARIATEMSRGHRHSIEFKKESA